MLAFRPFANKELVHGNGEVAWRRGDTRHTVCQFGDNTRQDIFAANELSHERICRLAVDVFLGADFGHFSFPFDCDAVGHGEGDGLGDFDADEVDAQRML